MIIPPDHDTVIAMSKLPIDNTTLVYGSNDAGQTLSYSNQEIIDKLKETAFRLNLKPHKYSKGNEILYSATDLGMPVSRHLICTEGHIGKDGRCYLVDFSRTFPPQNPKIDK